MVIQLGKIPPPPPILSSDFLPWSALFRVLTHLIGNTKHREDLSEGITKVFSEGLSFWNF